MVERFTSRRPPFVDDAGPGGKPSLGLGLRGCSPGSTSHRRKAGLGWGRPTDADGEGDVPGPRRHKSCTGPLDNTPLIDGFVWGAAALGALPVRDWVRFARGAGFVRGA